MNRGSSRRALGKCRNVDYTVGACVERGLRAVSGTGPPGWPPWTSTGWGGTAGFAVGALLSDIIADIYGIPAAVTVVAALTALSDIIVAIRVRSSDRGQG